MKTSGLGRGLLIGLQFALVACGGSVSGEGGYVDEAEEPVGASMEAIVGGTPATAYPEAAILNMRTAAGATYACSAAVIAPKVVLTAGHCVDGMAAWDVYVGTLARPAAGAEVYDYKANGSTTVIPTLHDVGLVYLKDPVTLSSYPSLSRSIVPDGTTALNVGRILNGSLTNSLYQASVTLKSAASIGYPYDYTSPLVIEHGDSGGPVFQSGTHTILAVNSGGGGGIQVLARVDPLYQWIQDRIASHGGTTSSGGATSSGTCAAEKESNNALAQANALSGPTCGSLSSATDVDWYLMTLAPGTARISVTADKDASFSIGYVAGSSCATSLTNQKVVQVSVSGAARQICLAVSSPSKATQSYKLTR